MNANVTTAAGRQLTESHRLAQARIGAETVRQLLGAWTVIDPRRLDATVTAWLGIAVPLVEAQRSKSVGVAANYLRTFRALELGTLNGFAPVLGQADPTTVATSLTVVGVASLKAATAKGKALDVAARTAQARTAAAGMRQALTGGRDTIVQTVAADPQARGWARVTSATPCDFCQMLADRGAVYGEDSADFQAHDSCGCSAEPAYE